jgi:predicted HAD superfamily Cof-like phosphohydrolase
MSQLSDVYRFMTACDQETSAFSPRQAALYLGLQLEELAEKLEAFPEMQITANLLHMVGDRFKMGQHDDLFDYISPEQKVKILDADMDLLWVSAGAALSLGADTSRAWNLLTDNNMAKIDPETGRARRHPETGKIMKPEGHKPPDFASCL